MKLTKEQRKSLEENLSYVGGTVHLLCDGNRVSLQVQRWKGLTARVITFINGEFKGTWFSALEEIPEHKFLRKTEISMIKPKDRAMAEKAFGKRLVAKEPIYSRKFVQYHPDWASGKAAINHLCRVCESVEIAPEVQP